jgi:hypothetical protein
MKGFEFTGPTFNAVVTNSRSGDFLGMGAIAERLYGRVFPGLNNNVRHVRAYSAICWAVDHVYTSATSSIADVVDVSKLADDTAKLLGKVQLLLTWQAWMDDQKFVPGLSPFKSDKNEWDLSFKDWKVSTTFMDQLFYLPGLVNGLGLIRRGGQRAKKTYSCTPAGKMLAGAFEMEVRLLPQATRKWLMSVNDVNCNKKRLAVLSAAVRLSNISKVEKAKFLHLYLEGTTDAVGVQEDPGKDHRLKNARKRKQSVLLALRALEALAESSGKPNGFVSVEAIRNAMSAGYAPSGKKLDLTGVEESWREWHVLQIRQLQRLALEVLLGLVERIILRKEQSKEPSFKRDICGAIRTLICETETGEIELSSTIAGDLKWYAKGQGKYPSLQAAGVCRSKDEEYFNIGRLGVYLRGQPWVLLPDDIEGTLDNWAISGQFAINALVYCAIEVENLRAQVRADKKANSHVEELLVMDADKLSLAELAKVVDIYKDKPLFEFVTEMISRCIIDQHLRTATSRSASTLDGKNRFVFTQESHGLSRWREGRRGKFVVAQGAHDVLLNAMLLLEDCGCLKVKLGTGSQGRYYREAAFKLEPAGRKLLANAAAKL